MVAYVVIMRSELMRTMALVRQVLDKYGECKNTKKSSQSEGLANRESFNLEP